LNQTNKKKKKLKEYFVEISQSSNEDSLHPASASAGDPGAGPRMDHSCLLLPNRRITWLTSPNKYALSPNLVHAVTARSGSVIDDITMNGTSVGGQGASHNFQIPNDQWITSVSITKAMLLIKSSL
jgi:hypothetical protein